MRFLYTFAYEKQAKAAALSKTAAFAEILTFCLKFFVYHKEHIEGDVDGF